jgi:hypothetical protein
MPAWRGFRGSDGVIILQHKHTRRNKISQIVDERVKTAWKDGCGERWRG